MTCLDDLALEKVLLDAAGEGALAHLAGCADCTGKLEVMKRENAQFRQYVYPATVDAVVASTRPRRWWAWALVPAALAASALLSFRTVEPPAEYVGVKGGTVGLAVFSLDATSAAVQLQDGAAVHADASLRFQVRPVAPCYLWVVSVDPLGQVSRLFPAEGEAARVTGDTTLPGGATLDGREGPERVIAVCTPAPVPFEAVVNAARVTTPEGVRAVRQLDLQGVQGSLLLEKRP